MEIKLNWIKEMPAINPKMVSSLLCNENMFLEHNQEMDSNKATGVDNVTKFVYETNYMKSIGFFSTTTALSRKLPQKNTTPCILKENIPQKKYAWRLLHCKK